MKKSHYFILLTVLFLLLTSCSNPFTPYIGVWKNTHKEYARATMVEFSIEDELQVITLWEGADPFKFRCKVKKRDEDFTSFSCAWKHTRYSRTFGTSFRMVQDTLFLSKYPGTPFDYPLGGPFIRIDEKEKSEIIHHESISNIPDFLEFHKKNP